MCRSALRSSTARSSASLRSVMSTATPSTCQALPFSARPRAAIHRTLPSGTGTRYSTSNSLPFAIALLTPCSRCSRSAACVVSRTLANAIGVPCELAARRRGGRGGRYPVSRHVPHEHGEPGCGRREIDLLLTSLPARSPSDGAIAARREGMQSARPGGAGSRRRWKSRANTGPTPPVRGISRRYRRAAGVRRCPSAGPHASPRRAHS